MEHFRSTLATTAAIVLGLAGAAHIIDPRDSTLEIRHSRPVVAHASTDGDAWADPPAQAATASPIAFVTSAQAAEPESAKPESATRPAPSLTLMPWPVLETTAREAAPRSEPRRKAERSRRQKAAQAELRRPAETRATADAAPAEPVPTRPQSAAQAASNGNPIGDLLRGLGIGRDREG